MMHLLASPAIAFSGAVEFFNVLAKRNRGKIGK